MTPQGIVNTLLEADAFDPRDYLTGPENLEGVLAAKGYVPLTDNPDRKQWQKEVQGGYILIDNMPVADAERFPTGMWYVTVMVNRRKQTFRYEKNRGDRLRDTLDHAEEAAQEFLTQQEAAFDARSYLMAKPKPVCLKCGADLTLPDSVVRYFGGLKGDHSLSGHFDLEKKLFQPDEQPSPEFHAARAGWLDREDHCTACSEPVNPLEEAFDPRAYLMAGETLPEALEAAGFSLRAGSSKGRPLYQRIDSDGGEEGPHTEGDRMWQVTIWDENMAILYLLNYGVEHQAGRASAWGWHFDERLSERRMSHRELIELLPRLSRDVVESDFSARDYLLQGGESTKAVERLYAEGWQKVTRSKRPAAYTQLHDPDRAGRDLFLFVYAYDESNDVYLHISSRTSGTRLASAALRPEQLVPVVNQLRTLMANDASSLTGLVSPQLHNILRQEGGQIEQRVVEAEGFDPREYITARVPDEQELRMRGAQQEDWGWRLDDGKGGSYAFIHVAPMWNVVHYGADGKTYSRWSDYLSTILDIVDKRMSGLPEALDEPFDAHAYLSRPQWPPSGFKPNGPNGKYGYESPAFKSGDGREFKLNIHTYPKRQEWILTLRGMYFGDWMDSDTETISWKDDLDDYLQTVYKDIARNRSTRSELPRLPDLEVFRQKSDPDLNVEEAGFDARRYLLNPPRSDSPLAQRAYWVILHRENEEMFLNVSNPHYPDGIWVIESAQATRFFDRREARKRANKFIKQGFNVEIVDAPVNEAEDFSARDYLLNPPVKCDHNEIIWNDQHGRWQCAKCKYIIGLDPQGNIAEAEGFDARAYLLGLDDWLVKRGYTMYNPEHHAYHKKWPNGARIAVLHRDHTDAWYVALFHFIEADKASTAIDRVPQDIPGTNEAEVMRVVEDYERKAQALPAPKSLPPDFMEESEDFDPREYLLSGGVDELRAWLESANFQRSRTATNESWQKLVFRGQGRVTKFWVWEAPNRPGLWYLQRSDTTPGRRPGDPNHEEIIFQHNGSPAQILFSCKRFVTADPFQPGALNRIGGFDESVVLPDEAQVKRILAWVAKVKAQMPPHARWDEQDALIKKLYAEDPEIQVDMGIGWKPVGQYHAGQRRVYVPKSAIIAGPESVSHVLRHELVHAGQHKATGYKDQGDQRLNYYRSQPLSKAYANDYSELMAHAQDVAREILGYAAGDPNSDRGRRIINRSTVYTGASSKNKKRFLKYVYGYLQELKPKGSGLQEARSTMPLADLLAQSQPMDYTGYTWEQAFQSIENNHVANAPEHWAAFLDSVRQHGIRKPVELERRGGKLRLHKGHHRVWAAHKLGLKDVPVKVTTQEADEFDARAYMLNSDEIALEQLLMKLGFQRTDENYWSKSERQQGPKIGVEGQGGWRVRRYDHIVHKEPGADKTDNPRIEPPPGEWVYRRFAMEHLNGPGGAIDGRVRGTASQVIDALEQWQRQTGLRSWIYAESEDFNAKDYLLGMPPSSTRITTGFDTAEVTPEDMAILKQKGLITGFNQRRGAHQLAPGVTTDKVEDALEWKRLEWFTPALGEAEDFDAKDYFGSLRAYEGPPNAKEYWLLFQEDGVQRAVKLATMDMVRMVVHRLRLEDNPSFILRVRQQDDTAKDYHRQADGSYSRAGS